MFPNAVTLLHLNYPGLVSLCDCCGVSFSKCPACANLKCHRTRGTDDSKWSSLRSFKTCPSTDTALNYAMNLRVPTF